MKYWLLPKTYIALTFTTPRKASELIFLHCKERMDNSHHLLFIYGKKELLTDSSDVWSSSP